MNWAEDFYYKNTSLTEISLGVEFRKNLNNVGRPLYIGTSFWVSNSCFSNRFESVKKQMITPQLSLSKRTSTFFTFEFFVNYPIVFHSTISSRRNINRYPQIGINMYIY
jgi:hypothetical protein